MWLDNTSHREAVSSNPRGRNYVKLSLLLLSSLVIMFAEGTKLWVQLTRSVKVVRVHSNQRASKRLATALHVKFNNLSWMS